MPKPKTKYCVRFHTDCTDAQCDVHIFGPFDTELDAHKFVVNAEKAIVVQNRDYSNHLFVVTDLQTFEDMF